jgi:TP901 family phage tail tape measure protein
MADRTVRVILKAEVADYKRQMAEAVKATDHIPASAAKAETALGKMVQSARYNRESWDMAGRAMVGFGAATLAGLGLAVNAAVQWESAWTGVLKTVNGTDDELSALEGSLRDMARTLPASHAEIAGVAEAAGQLGVQTSAVAGFTRVMIDLGETTNLAADEAATSLAQLMNVMQTSAGDVDNLGSAVVALGNDGASTERDIVLMAQRIAGAGAMIGMSEGDVLGLSNALASVGIDAEAGGTAISKIMIDMATAVSTNSADLEKWASVAGMTASGFAAAFKEAPAEAIATFVEGLGQMNAAGGDVFTTLADLGQSDVRVTRALLTMANAGDLLRESLELGNTSFEDNNALMIEAAKRYDTAASKLEVAKNGINDAAITIGQAFLPMVADAASGVADLAGWIGQLPAPVQQAAGGLTAIAGSASLAVGGFLMLFPRVMETVTGFKNLMASGSRIPGMLGTIGKAAGVVAVVAALVMVADAAQSATISAEELANRLIAIKDEGAGIETLFSDIGQGWADDWFGQQIDTGNVDKFSESLRQLSDWEGLGAAGDFTLMFEDITGLDGGLRQLRVRLEAVGEQFGMIAQTDLPQAQAQFKAVADAAGGSDEAVRNLLDRMPGYRDALYAAATAQGVTLDETQLLAIATGDLALSSIGAADGLGVLAGTGEYVRASTEQITGAVEESAAATEEWAAMVAGASAAFIDLPGAYQAVIDANTAWAQSTADATASSTDSWATYYNGTTVSAADYIAQLQAEVDAQAAWQANIVTLTAMAGAGMTTSMSTAAYAMIDELTALGPEGAAQIALLASMSSTEFAQVVSLYAQKGDAAGAAFVGKIKAIKNPVINVGAQMAPGAQAAIDKFFNANANRTLSVRVGAGGGKFDTGGYTGDLAVNDVAGVVHGREFVINAAATARNRPALEAINAGRSVPGYAAGGYVQPAYTPGTTQTSSAPSSLAGVLIEGTLDLGGGLVGVMRGVVRSEISDAQRSRTATAVQGVRG